MFLDPVGLIAIQHLKMHLSCPLARCCFGGPVGGWWVGGACCFVVATVFCLRYFKGIRALLVLRSIFSLCTAYSILYNSYSIERSRPNVFSFSLPPFLCFYVDRWCSQTVLFLLRTFSFELLWFSRLIYS